VESDPNGDPGDEDPEVLEPEEDEQEPMGVPPLDTHSLASKQMPFLESGAVQYPPLPSSSRSLIKGSLETESKEIESLTL